MNELLILFALGIAGPAQQDGQGAQPESTPRDVITWPVDHRPLTRRWTGSRLESRVDRQSCGDAIIRIEYQITAVGHRRFARINRVEIDRRRVAQRWIQAANEELANFSDDPLILAECVGQDYRLRLVDRAGVRPSPSRLVPLGLAYRRSR